jgi:hypothetical protein
MPKKHNYKFVKEYIESKGCKLLNNEYKNYYEDLDILFTCGHIAKRSFKTFKHSAPYCYNCIKNIYTLDIIENKLKEKGYILISHDNIGGRIEIEDSKGYRYNTIFSNFVSSVFKGLSNLYRFHSKNSFTTYNIKKFLEINYPDIYLMDGEKWINALTKMNFIDKNGYKFFVVFGSIKNGYYPNKFSNSNPYISENIELFLKLNNKNFILLPNQKVNDVNDILSFKCNICDNDEIPFRKTFKSIEFGDGCPYCSGKKVGKKNNLFYLYPELCREWDYNKNENLLPEYVTSGNPKKVWWMCPNCNQSYFSSISKRAKDGRGCPKCCESHLEKKISKFLNDNYIAYVPQMRFDDCKDVLSLPFDFYIVENNILCEAQGEQHFFVSKFFGGQEGYDYRKKHDVMKKEYCKQKNIELIEIPYWDLDNIEIILSQKLNLQ